jgi:putative ABC transport system permease protein
VLVALLGTTLGSAIGLAFAWSLVEAMKDKGFNTFTVPVQQLAAIVLFAAVAAVFAAALPARRASKLDVLAALSTQ